MSAAATEELKKEVQSPGRGEYHYLHPTDPEKMWCGSPRVPGPIVDPHRSGLRPTCVVCVDLRAAYGIDGWLDLRRGGRA
jgi:hypothetical protein